MNSKIEFRNERSKHDFVRLFKAMAWLDSKRWEHWKNRDFVNFFDKNVLTNCEKILTHWICYITDRQMAFEKIWDEGAYIFSELVYDYSRKVEEKVQYILEKYLNKKEEDIKFFKSISNEKKKFTPRYPNIDYKSILQTLEVLDKKYERNLIKYILNFLKKFKEKEDLLRRIACTLYILTYKLHNREADSDKALENIEKNFEEIYREFNKTATEGKKRLWCCIRDYKKGPYHKTFINAIKEVAKKDSEELINLWNNLPMDQIELPGDVWNNNENFRKNFIEKILNLDNIPKSWNMSKIIRKIYEQLKENQNIDDSLYPELFDVTFDFVPRMCSKKLCDICFFSNNGAEKICIPTENKYCPALLVSCGYMVKCKENDCIIKKDITKGLCNGL